MHLPRDCVPIINVSAMLIKPIIKNSIRSIFQINFLSYSDERFFYIDEELFSNKLINLIILVHCNNLHKLPKLR